MKLDITLVLYERGVPWHIALLLRQLCIKLTMCGAVERHPLDLAVSVALISIEESADTDRSEVF
jgi:hypothetical protein